jgi:hypothetical protein
VELGSLFSEIASAVLIAFAALIAITIALLVAAYVYARRAGRWVRTTLHRQRVNLAPGPARDLVRMRTRLERSRHGAQTAMTAATATGEAVGDLGLLCARLEAVGEGLDEQLEVLATADLSAIMLKAALPPLRTRVDSFERIATELASVAATSIVATHGVELAAINDEVDQVRQVVRARTDALQELRAH